MKLDTSYMGLKLKNPIIAGASPMTASSDSIKRLEDAGAAAIVLHSIFEEQINHEAHEVDHFLFKGGESYAEAVGYFPDMELTNLESEHYLEDITALKKNLSIPLIALSTVYPKGAGSTMQVNCRKPVQMPWNLISLMFQRILIWMGSESNNSIWMLWMLCFQPSLSLSVSK